MTDHTKNGDTIVPKKSKQPTYYFRLEGKLIEKLDRRIARAGCRSRRDFFTAVAYVALYGDKTENLPDSTEETDNIKKLPETVSAWVKNTMPRITEEEIQSGLHQIIADMLTPVIAMKGVDIAYEHTWEDVRHSLHQKSGVWVTESDLREAYRSFAAMHKTELQHYREKQLRTTDQEP